MPSKCNFYFLVLSGIFFFWICSIQGWLNPWLWNPLDSRYSGRTVIHSSGPRKQIQGGERKANPRPACPKSHSPPFTCSLPLGAAPTVCFPDPCCFLRGSARGMNVAETKCGRKGGCSLDLSSLLSQPREASSAATPVSSMALMPPNRVTVIPGSSEWSQPLF